MPSKRSRSVTGALLVAVVRLAWTALVIATPLLGAWVASSLAAYSNGPIWLAAATGLLLFPVAPAAWELFASWRRARRGVTRARILTRADRLVLRTLGINVVFLGALLAWYPQRGFIALETRGDWMLEGQHDAHAQTVRHALFRAAGGLEWLYVAARPNPYRAPDPGTRVHPSPTPGPHEAPSRAPDDTTPQPVPSVATEVHRWPFANRPDPLVSQIPATEEGSIESVGHWFAEHAPDPWDRIKALHDWVADRIAYDAPAYSAGQLPPEDGDAEHTFRTRVGVCAGYARLLQRMGRAAGLDVQYIVGDGRPAGGPVEGESHAWNAVKLDGRWYLIDATWDAGTSSGAVFTRRYSSEYFLTPADVFALSHFPDESEWQLLDRPLSRGEFFRAPMLTPAFFARGLTLRSPTRSQVTVDAAPFAVEIGNPVGDWLMASVFPATGGTGTRCEADHGTVVHVQCQLPGPGSWIVHLYAAREQYGDYPYVGQLAVNRAR